MVLGPMRERIHALVDQHPDGDLADVEQYLESFSVADPAHRAALMAPIDDEPLTSDEIAVIDQAKREIARGEYVMDDELDALLSLPTE